MWNTARPIFVPCRIALIDALNVYEWIVSKIVSKIVCKIVSKIVRFRVDNSENWRIVLAVERMESTRSDNVEVLQISDAFSCDADDERFSSH